MDMSSIDIDDFEARLRQAGIIFNGTVSNGDKIYLVDNDGKEIQLTKAQQEIFDNNLEQTGPPKIMKIASVEDDEEQLRNISPAFRKFLEAMREEDISLPTKELISTMLGE